VVVGTHNFGPTYCGAALKAITGKPLVSWVHGPLLDVLQEAGTSAVKKLWLRLLYKQVSQFVCVSRTTQDSLLSFITLGQQQRCTVVPNGIAPMPVGQPIHVHAGHGGEGIPPLLLGYVGRLSAEKRPHLLLDTLRCLPDEAQLGIVGEGPMHRQMIHDGMDLMYQGRLHFLGKHPSGESLYKPWQMTLLTSRYEGCPMTALESLACGVPCVALPIPAMRELYDRDALNHVLRLRLQDHHPLPPHQTVLSLALHPPLRCACCYVVKKIMKKKLAPYHVLVHCYGAHPY
jgi:glycosyltransferase involved in cell wall biosynthesis